MAHASEDEKGRAGEDATVAVALLRAPDELLSTLPIDIALAILHLAGPHAAASALATCRGWRHSLAGEAFFQRYFELLFPDATAPGTAEDVGCAQLGRAVLAAAVSPWVAGLDAPRPDLLSKDANSPLTHSCAAVLLDRGVTFAVMHSGALRCFSALGRVLGQFELRRLGKGNHVCCATMLGRTLILAGDSGGGISCAPRDDPEAARLLRASAPAAVVSLASAPEERGHMPALVSARADGCVELFHVPDMADDEHVAGAKSQGFGVPGPPQILRTPDPRVSGCVAVACVAVAGCRLALLARGGRELQALDLDHPDLTHPDLTSARQPGLQGTWPKGSRPAASSSSSSPAPGVGGCDHLWVACQRDTRTASDRGSGSGNGGDVGDGSSASFSHSHSPHGAGATGAPWVGCRIAVLPDAEADGSRVCVTATSEDGRLRWWRVSVSGSRGRGSGGDRAGTMDVRISSLPFAGDGSFGKPTSAVAGASTDNASGVGGAAGAPGVGRGVARATFGGLSAGVVAIAAGGSLVVALRADGSASMWCAGPTCIYEVQAIPPGACRWAAVAMSADASSMAVSARTGAGVGSQVALHRVDLGPPFVRERHPFSSEEDVHSGAAGGHGEGSSRGSAPVRHKPPKMYAHKSRGGRKNQRAQAHTNRARPQ
mmetsp:Transcript_3006/g.8767  ORF Transcript_3006/g.8767 Transcript_3006/m.8767 type:complete len:658 (-) Transcript_3006:227-2200(-)